MGTDQSDQEASEDRVNADDAGKESRGKSHEHSQGYDGLTRAMLPDFLKIQRKAGRTPYARNRTYATQVSKTYNAVNPAPALTRATQRASNIQPTTSLPTPADRTTTPTWVCRSLSSVRIRHNTGKACHSSVG